MIQRLSQLSTRLTGLLEFIKFSHTIFALPFALMAMLTAGAGRVSVRVVLLILLCMVSARTAAMCFNRLADWEIDKENPRTAGRHRLISKSLGWFVMVASLLLLTWGAWSLNPLCFYLTPLATFMILFYSLTKRFTEFPHFFLGLALSAAPMGAWAAVRGELYDLAPWVLASAVLCWVFGFDLIYATLDMEFDRKQGLFSFPARYGLEPTLLLARILHGVAAIAFAGFGCLAGFSWIYAVAWLLSAGGLIYELQLCRKPDVGRINRAFFQVNAVVSMTLLLGAGMDLWMRR